jgi:hypothetical protein
MKRILTLVILGFFLISATTFGTPDEIINALKKGNSTEVSQYFDNFVDIMLPEKDEVKNMGKNQASIALKTFYEEMNVKTFQITSQREAGSIMYITGKLQGKVKDMNLTLILKNTDSKYSITSIRIG